jgi:parallel beta-helix repeat protein
MNGLMRSSCIFVLLAALCAAPARSETTECTVISSIPITISTQGVYCLKSDLASSASGAMITIATNNVSIDFNRYKLGGQAGGIATTAIGVYANNRLNVRLTNGVVRGFKRGIEIDDGSGHVIEGMTLDGNTQAGIYLSSVQNALVRGNQVVNTGGTSFAIDTYGIYTDGTNVRVINNDVADTIRNSGNVQTAYAIRNYSNETIVDDNRVTNTADHGIYSSNNLHISISHNRIHNSIAGGLIGIRTNTGPSICRDNTVSGYATPYDCGTVDGGGNVSYP